jgi:hypothetical protein
MALSCVCNQLKLGHPDILVELPTIRSQTFLNSDALDKSEFLALSQQRGHPRLAFQRSLLPRRRSHRKQQGALHLQ